MFAAADPNWKNENENGNTQKNSEKKKLAEKNPERKGADEKKAATKKNLFPLQVLFDQNQQTVSIESPISTECSALCGYLLLCVVRCRFHNERTGDALAFIHNILDFFCSKWRLRSESANYVQRTCNAIALRPNRRRWLQ